MENLTYIYNLFLKKEIPEMYNIAKSIKWQEEKTRSSPLSGNLHFIYPCHGYHKKIVRIRRFLMEVYNSDVETMEISMD